MCIIGAGIGNICMAPLIAHLVEQFSYFGSMLILGALLLNNAVGGALYRMPPATPQDTPGPEQSRMLSPEEHPKDIDGEGELPEKVIPRIYTSLLVII